MATAITERPTERRAGGHYRAYTPRPFTRAERDSVTILFGGLHWRVERVLQAVLESAGHQAQVLPVATKDDLLTGREVADIGQCCPTSFTTGNLVNFLKKEAKATSAEEVNKKFVYLTAGSCGACRFGQYHQSYELALRNSGLDAFRMFLLAQDQLDQKAAMGDGLDLNLPVTLGCLWAIFCTDLVQDLEYQVRPFEVVPGQTEAVVRESIELLYQAFRHRPEARALAVRALVPHHRLLREGHAADPPQVRRHRGGPAAGEAGGEDHRRVLSPDRRGRSQLQHPPLARGGGRRGLPGRHHGVDGLPAAPGAAALRGLLGHREGRAPQARARPDRAGASTAASWPGSAGRWAISRATSRTSSSCGGWPRPTSTAASTAARATCWSARRSGPTRRRRPT